MEWPDASNFACLISGYYKLFVDPKRTIYCRIPGQPYMIKAGMLEMLLLQFHSNIYIYKKSLHIIF